MTRLTWGDVSNRVYESGLDRGVLYSELASAVVWNGLVSIKENTSDSDVAVSYLDGVKYRNRQNSGSYSATIEAFTYPDEFSQHDGLTDGFVTQQRRKPFSLCYRTNARDLGYKIHLVYNALVSPSPKDYVSVSESIEATTFSWGIETSPALIQGVKSTAHLFVDTTKANALGVASLENVLYGTDDVSPSMPSPDFVVSIFEALSPFRVIDNGDGTFTVIGSDAAIQILDPTTFQITSSSAVMIDGVRYKLSSL